jgi:uncharacterized protein (UPF0262 family)
MPAADLRMIAKSCLHFAGRRRTEADRNMADPRIIDIKLDERTILWRYAGPYKVVLRVEEGRLVIEINRDDDSPLEAVILGLGRFRRPIREYFAICDSYYQAISNASPAQIETVDMARRGIHNDAAEMLRERLEGKIEVDFDTARRLFTLICVLHIKG